MADHDLRPRPVRLLEPSIDHDAAPSGSRVDKQTPIALEAGSDPRHRRSPEEIAKFRDRRVRVIGTFVRQMPQVAPPEAAQLGGACIRDVESIGLDE
jgi:hypothetical protein